MLYICARAHARIVTECYRYLWLSFHLFVLPFPASPTGHRHASVPQVGLGKAGAAQNAHGPFEVASGRPDRPNKNPTCTAVTLSLWSAITVVFVVTRQLWSLCKAAACNQEDVWKTMNNWGSGEGPQNWGPEGAPNSIHMHSLKHTKVWTVSSPASRMNCFAPVCCCGELWAEPFCWFLVFKGRWRTLKDTEGISWRPKNRMGWRSLDVPIKGATDCKKHHLRPDVEGLWCIISRRETPVGCHRVPRFSMCSQQLQLWSSDHHRIHQNLWESVRICRDLLPPEKKDRKAMEAAAQLCPAMPSYAQLCPAMPSYAQPSSQARVEVDRGEAGAWMRWEGMEQG